MSQLQLLKRESQVEVPATGEKYVAEDGTVSQVLDDTASPDYEPTEAEITEFAEWIGMKLPEDQPYLWMAREALKTPLPKEWRPCRTEEDEVYYFNFKTGDSQWEHPLDDQFRQRFAKEKERVQKGGALAAAAAATRRSQDRVIMTASGVLRVDGSGTTQPASTTATATTTTTTTAAAPAKSAVASKSPGTSVEDGAPTSGSLSSLMSTTNGAAGRQLAPSMSRGTPNTSAVAGAATGSSVSANNNNNNNSNNMRILSEAERNLESRIHAEMQKEFEVEQATRSEEQARKLAELRALHNKDLSELRAVHEKRLEVIQSELEGSMRSAATEMRRRCDDAFRPRFDELQQQTNQSQGQLNEMEAAYERAGGAARSVIIAKAEDDLKKELKRVEEDVRRRQVIKQKELQQRFLETKTLMEESSKTALVDARTALEKTFYQHEMEAAKTTEARRKALETQKKKLEQDLSANKAQLAAAAAAPPRASSSSASAVGSTPTPAPLDASTLPEVQEIQRRQRKLSEEIAAQSTRDVAAIERETENRLTALRAEYAKAAAAAKTSSLNTSVSSSTTAGGSPTTPFAQHLRALKSRYNAKKAEQLRALGEDRDRQLSSIRRPSATASTASNSADGAEGGSPLQLLQQKHDAELAEKKAFYKSVREQVGQQLRSELEDSASISQSIARAVEHDMAAYTQEVAARHARLAAEMEQKRAKALEEHRIARQNYDKRVELEKQRRRDDEEDAMESMMEGIIADAVADVRRTGEAQTEAMLATRRKAATMAEAAVRAEVDAFMTALEAAEHKKMDLEVEASRAASAATSAAAASEAGARQAEELARRRCDMDQQRRVQEEEVRSLQSQLRQREERLRDIMREKVEAQTQAQAAVPVAGTYTPPPAPAAASPGAAVERTIIVVPRKVQPPRSLVRADHQQRLQRLEMSYQAEVERLRALPPPAAEMPLQHSSIINGTSPIHPSHTSSNPAVVVEVGGGGGSPVATSHAMTTTTTTTTAPPATRAEALNFSADDARRYWKQQQQAMQQTQQNLLAAREEWSQDVWYLQQQQQQQQQQQVQLQQSYRQSSPVATGGSYPRRMATPSCGYDHLSAPSALTTNTSPLIALVGSLHQRLDALTEATSLLQRSSSAGGGGRPSRRSATANARVRHHHQDPSSLRHAKVGMVEPRSSMPSLTNKWRSLLSTYR